METRTITITFGTGKDKVVHIVESNNLLNLLNSLNDAGWRINEITSIKIK